MVRFSHIMIAYFVMGAVMWAGGAIAWGNAGVGGLLIDDPSTGDLNSSTTDQLEKADGPIEQAVGSVGGGALLAVWGIVSGIFGYLFWPISVLVSNGAPARVWVPLGGAPTVAFYGALIRLIRTSG